MTKDPLFASISFYWLTISFSMFGMFILVYLLALIGFLLRIPITMYYAIKRVL